MPPAPPTPPPKRPLPRAVWLLSWVSFFADVSGEMIFPLFLVGLLGSSKAQLGMIAIPWIRRGYGRIRDRWEPKPAVLPGATTALATLLNLRLDLTLNRPSPPAENLST